MTYHNPWSPVREEELKRLHAEGYSSSQIAAVFGASITRNSVIGKLNRMGVEAPSDIKKIIRQRRQTQQRLPRLIAELALRDATLASKAAPVPSLMNGHAEPVPKHLNLLDLNGHTCRYPLGESLPYTFCGHPPEHDQPYCPHHCTIVYVGRKKFRDWRGA